MKRLYQVILSILPLLLPFAAQSQTTTVTTVTDDRFAPPEITDEMTVNPEQNKMWRTGQSRYSAKPKSMWELGIHAGPAFVSGDVEAPFPAGYGFGLHVRKAINYTLSWRLDVSYQSSKGYDARSFNFLAAERTYSQNIADFPVLAAYTDESIQEDNIHRNYKANILGVSFEGILNIGNVLFHNPSNKWNFYGVIGGGLNFPETAVDLLHDGQPYDFSGVQEGLDLTTQDGRNESRKRLKELLDGDFETEGGIENDIIAIGDHKTIIPHFSFAVGLSRKLSKRINLGIEHRVLISDNDLLDAFEDRTSLDETTSNDVPHYTSVRLGINLGSFEKRIEPLYWVNPLDGSLNDIAELKQRPKFDLTDTDGDGVIDMTDQEINTPAGCPVDTRGVTLDSDGDSVVDCKDQEPYSPPGFEVDRNGVAQNADPFLTEDEVVTLINQRMESSDANLNWFLPMIHFDLDKYYIKPEFYGALHNIAGVMKSHPDMKVVAAGYADNRDSDEYNNVLSYNRANEAISYLVNNYNLPRSRFILQYGGETSPIAPGLKDNHSTSLTQEKAHYVNRRVEFRVATATDTDMSRPAGPEAGDNSPGSARPGSKYSGNFNSGY
jgi:outer membrane protein OmpA-like peptidoglycan-associated protein